MLLRLLWVMNLGASAINYGPELGGSPVRGRAGPQRGQCRVAPRTTRQGSAPLLRALKTAQQRIKNWAFSALGAAPRAAATALPSWSLRKRQQVNLSLQEVTGAHTGVSRDSA